MRARVLAQSPNLLAFFIFSTAWSASAFGLLQLGGEAHLAIGGALILPMTLLLFIRPVPLPYAWAAPPEPLSSEQAGLAGALLLSLLLYHAPAVLNLARRGASKRAWGTRWSMRGERASAAGLAEDDLVGPSLHL